MVAPVLTTGTDIAVTLYKKRGQYGVRVWDSTDEEGFPIKIEQYAPRRRPGPPRG